MSSTARSRGPTPLRRTKSVFWLKFAALAGVAVVALGASVGVGQSPAPKPSDDVLQMRVQSALDNDAVLKRHKLTVLVNVVDRLAVIGGPVPDAAVAARMETVAKAVPGIAGVRVSVWVPASLVPDDPLSKKVAELMKPEPARAAVVPPAAPLLAVPPTSPATSARPAAPSPVAPSPVPATDRRPGGKVTSNKGPDGLLLDPVAPTGTGFRPLPPAPGAAALPYATIPPPNVPPHPPQPEPEPPARPSAHPPADLSAGTAVTGLDELRSDRRFTGLTVEVVDGVAVVSGRPAGGSERSWELAQAVRKLPGVERVVVRRP